VGEKEETKGSHKVWPACFIFFPLKRKKKLIASGMNRSPTVNPCMLCPPPQYVLFLTGDEAIQHWDILFSSSFFLKEKEKKLFRSPFFFFFFFFF